MSQSRVEAILENILGAENILDEPQSRIESILQSILYDTSYDKSPQSRIEEMLVCLKNDTEYTIEPQSRIEEIILAKIEQIEYTKPTQSRIEKLLVEWLYKDLHISLSGTPPLTFKSNGEPLKKWQIYGNAGGVGERTANLFNSADSEQGFYLDDQGETTQNSNYLTSAFIPVSADASYTISLINHYPTGGWYFRVALYDASQNFIDFAVEKVYGGDGGAVLIRTDSFTIGEAELIRFCCLKNNLDVMLNVGSQAMSYEPYGYKIPVTCGGETTNIYIGENPLDDGESISSAEAGTEIPTINGQNTLIVDTTVQPSKVDITYAPKKSEVKTR